LFVAELVKTIYKRDQRFWARRPLTRDMILYAAYDVLPLVPSLYDVLNTAIKVEFRPLLDELCVESLQALLQPDDVTTFWNLILLFHSSIFL
jgi:exonuclease 3'-5' domain-containing protein 1